MMEFKMPDIGEGVMEGEVVKWLVGVGDTVAEDDPLVEVMTDKATVVIPCPVRGSVHDILVAEGATARVGQTLVVFAEPGAAPAVPGASAAPVAETVPMPTPTAAPTLAAAPAPAAPPPVPVTASAPAPAVAPESLPGARPAARLAESAATPPQPAAPVTPPPAIPGGSHVLAAPATRRMAREAGIELSQVSPSGPHGRVTRDDLLDFLEGRSQELAAPVAAARSVRLPATEHGGPGEAPPASPAPAAGPARAEFPAGQRPVQRIPVRGMRKRIAENMRRSKDHAAHFTYVEECDMTELVAMREKARPLATERQIRMTYLPFIVKAVVSGLKAFPYLNASYDEDAQEIVLKGYYNVGIASSTDEGLIVPVVKNCDSKGILELAADIQALGDAARVNRLRVEDLQDSTFTITSLGTLGGVFATPVIYHPEVAILGVHKIRRQPVVRDDQIVVRDICYLSVSLDHRVIDGHIGAQFMQHVVRLLQEPQRLLLGG